MQSLLLKKSATLIAGILIPVFALASTSVYVVKAGDTLTGVLHELSEQPVYGKDGSLAEVLLLNPKKFKTGGDRIYPGDQIILPDAFQTRMAKVDDTTMRCEGVDLSATGEQAVCKDEVARVIASLPEPETDDIKSVFSLGVGADYFRIDNTDVASGSKSATLSNLSPSLLLGWKLQWNDQTAFVTRATFERYSLQSPKLITFDHVTGMRSAFSFEVQQKFSERFQVGLGIGVQDRLFFHASGITELTVDQVMIASPGLSVRHAFFSKPGGQVGLFGSAALLLPASNSFYDVKTGTHVDLGAFISRHAVGSNHGFDLNFNYSIDSQDTSILTGTEKRFLINLIYNLQD